MKEIYRCSGCGELEDGYFVSKYRYCPYCRSIDSFELIEDPDELTEEEQKEWL